MTLHFRPENAKKNKKELKKSQQPPPLRDYCMQVKRQLEAECNGNMSGNLEIEIPEKIPQGSKKSQPGMGAFTTPNRKLAENASESTPRNKRKEQESFPIETPGKIPKTDLINRSLFSTPTGRNAVHPPTPSM